jgi:hypothetical protein
MTGNSAKHDWVVLKRYLLALVCGAIGVVLCAVLLVPVALWAFFPPPSVQAAKDLAAVVASTVPEATVSQFLTACERDIRAGLRADTDCTPPSLGGTNGPLGKFRCVSGLEGTNLLVTANYSDGANPSFTKIRNDPTVQSAGHVGKFSRGIKIGTNCWDTVDFLPK